MDSKMGIISNVSTSLFEALFRLLEILDSSEAQAPNEVQANSVENGLSCSIIILIVTIIDSFIGRAKYMTHVSPKGSSIEYFRTLTGNDHLATDLEEMYAIRDVIVHNHLWKGEVRWRPGDYQLEYTSPPKLSEEFGDWKFRKVLDVSSRMSRVLNLNLVPIRIWRRDAYIVIKKMADVLLAIESRDRNYAYVSHLSFLYKNELKDFAEIVMGLKLPEDK
jgi:hypothetical protein